MTSARTGVANHAPATTNVPTIDSQKRFDITNPPVINGTLKTTPKQEISKTI
jgi:hypothetical protein